MTIATHHKKIAKLSVDSPLLLADGLFLSIKGYGHMNKLNLSLIEGTLNTDPELFYTKNGTSICKFSVEVVFITDNVEQKSYITVNTWNKVADACSRYLIKGSRIRARGKLKQDEWTNEEGLKRTRFYVEAESIDFVASPKGDK